MNKMSQSSSAPLVMNEIVHALRAIFDENEKARDSAIAVSLVFWYPMQFYHRFGINRDYGYPVFPYSSLATVSSCLPLQSNKTGMFLCFANRIPSFLRVCYKDCCDTKSGTEEKVGEFKVAVCSVYFEYAFINRAYRKGCDSAFP